MAAGERRPGVARLLARQLTAHDQTISRRLGTYELVRGCGFVVVVVLTACPLGRRRRPDRQTYRPIIFLGTFVSGVGVR